MARVTGCLATNITGTLLSFLDQWVGLCLVWVSSLLLHWHMIAVITRGWNRSGDFRRHSMAGGDQGVKGVSLNTGVWTVRERKV